MKFGDRSAFFILTFCACSTLATVVMTYDYKSRKAADKQQHRYNDNNKDK